MMCLGRGLFAMNNKMAINTYLSTIESKKQTKQTSATETEARTWNVLMVTRGRGSLGEWVKR